MTFFKQLTLACSLLAVSPSWADGVVIAHGGVSLTEAEVRDVFVGEKQTAGATKLVVLDNSAAQADFLAKVIKVDAAKYASIWAKKGFREGLSPPAVRSSDSEIIAAVKSTPGAVGYVSKAPADVKVIAKY